MEIKEFENNIDYFLEQYKDIESFFKLKESSKSKEDKKKLEKLDLLLAEADNYRYERHFISQGKKIICGVDEVGRGPLCGPVVTCACILPDNFHLEGLTDSKKLTEKKRDKYYDILTTNKDVHYAIGIVDNKRIDEINILEAAREAMYQAISKLDITPDVVLSDAMDLPDLSMPYLSIVKGDYKSESIAAASVIAKVTRDRMMYELDKKYPEYGFRKHKGYPTKDHIEAVKKYGVKPFYRFTFSPISEIINEGCDNLEK